MSNRRVVRCALTETKNAYKKMPDKIEDLHLLNDRLDDIRKANVDHHIDLMRAAAQQGVQVICFGELFTAPYFALGTDPMWLPLAEDARSGPTVTELSAAAKELNLIVVAPIFEYDSIQDKRYNTAVVIDETGTVLGKFRKAHIPYGANEQGAFHENFYYGRSDGRNCGQEPPVDLNTFYPVFETKLGRIGIGICYDRHFHYVAWNLANNGAELVFFPAITFGEKSERMWQVEFPTDAARHNVFIGGSNRRGVEAPWTQPYFGKSYFVGPNGNLPNLSQHENLIVADVDLTTLSEPDPSGWNLPRDTRQECIPK